MKKFLIVLTTAIISGCSCNITKLSHLQWQTQNDGGDTSFRGLCAVSDKVVWASGSGGTFARTINGGKNWQVAKIAGAENIDLRDIEAFDEKTAVVFGIASPAKFYKTTDGGKNWNLVYQNDNNDVFFSAACFRNKKEAIALSDPVGEKFFLLQTRDGGDNWTKLNEQSFPTAIKGEGIFAASGSNIAMPDENTIIFVTGCTAARVFISTDKGANWSYVNSPLESGAETNGIFSIAMKNKKEGIIVGGDYKKENETKTNAAVTTDGGKSWTLVKNNKPSGFRECVKYIPGTNTVITVGPNGSDISYDGGKNFEKFDSPIGLHTLAVSPNGKTCWAAGRNGRIVKLIRKDR
jgi:photosystem II stability/assembly factor-like uncharacterized protein